jgi:hypothetical protein
MMISPLGAPTFGRTLIFLSIRFLGYGSHHEFCFFCLVSALLWVRASGGETDNGVRRKMFIGGLNWETTDREFFHLDDIA